MVQHGKHDQQGTATSWALLSLSIVLKAPEVAIGLSLLELYVPSIYIYFQFPFCSTYMLLIQSRGLLKSLARKHMKHMKLYFCYSVSYRVPSPRHCDFGSKGQELPLAVNMAWHSGLWISFGDLWVELEQSSELNDFQQP